ncbi:MAG: histidinol-phosphate transaminase [Betaproteobacteria bacterium]|nr:histidinol-phosphate transaminase [Betaproteobacteria bacterium]
MTDACELAPSYVRAIAPYQAGKPISELAREMGLDENNIVKLASNENPLGCSPLARQAVEREMAEVARYPDSNGFSLKAAIAKHCSVAQEQIVLGSGSNDVLEMVAKAMLHPGCSSVYSQYAFIVYPLAVQAMGATPIAVPAKNFGHDLDAMVAAVRHDTRVLWIANPNNPTGTFVPAQVLKRAIARIPASVIVVVDEAYNEYLSDALRVNTAAWLGEFPNLVITRTLSKAYGLAGLRVGYALMHTEVAGLLNRVRQPFNVSSLAQAAAVDALADQDFVRGSAAANAQGMIQITEGVTRFGLQYIASHGNFVTVKVGAAGEVYQRLLRQGVIVRPVAGYGMPEHLRVSIGLPRENERFLSALAASLHA